MIVRAPVHVSMGDSLASGEGIGLATPPRSTWPGLLATAAGARFLPLARGGAPVATVIRDQLPAARALSPELACVCVGLNDLFRSGGVTDRAPSGIQTLLRGLRAAGTTVIVGRLHDPTRLVWFPGRFGRLIRDHVAAVNAALDEFRPDPGVLLLEISALHGRPECWAVDRIHPSGFGHRVLAGQAADRLGLPFQVGPAPVAPSVTAFWRWVGRHGVPWLAARTPELVTSEPLRRATRRIAYGTGV